MKIEFILAQEESGAKRHVGKTRMNQRLVWNFEFSKNTSIPFASLIPDKRDNLKWESRFFWPDNQPITLININDSLLDLTKYEQKHKNDYYYLLPDTTLNIKRRGQK